MLILEFQGITQPRTVGSIRNIRHIISQHWLDGSVLAGVR